jgi:hypothetical protein
MTCKIIVYASRRYAAKQRSITCKPVAECTRPTSRIFRTKDCTLSLPQHGVFPATALPIRSKKCFGQDHGMKRRERKHENGPHVPYSLTRPILRTLPKELDGRPLASFTSVFLSTRGDSHPGHSRVSASGLWDVGRRWRRRRRSRRVLAVRQGRARIKPCSSRAGLWRRILVRCA